MRRYTFGLMGAFGLAAGGMTQVPMQMPDAPVAGAAFQQPAPKGQDKKADEPRPQDPPPPVTFPATNRAALPASAVAAAGTSIRRSSQPNVFGDLCLTGTSFSPYLVATLPNGQQLSILPGQTVFLPPGTTFDRSVQTQTIVIPGRGETPNNPNGTPPRTVVQVTGTDPIAHAGGLPVNVVRGAFKIMENESPRPTDRVYVTYNFFSDVNPTLSVPGLPITNVHRETFGIEKTFLEGNASIGLRLPLLQIGGPFNIARQSVGDLSIIAKYAIINDWYDRGDGSVMGGDVLSTGFVVTAPTGNAATYSALCPEIHPTVIQPYIGFLKVWDRAFIQGFSSFAFPTDDRDTTFFFNSIQLGYRLYESPTDDRWLRSFSPIAECHVNTPLNNRGLTRLPIGSMDVVSFTGGGMFGIGRSAFLNLGCNVPVTGPKPYAIEAMAHLNIVY
jgi:hypothetical protein